MIARSFQARLVLLMTGILVLLQTATLIAVHIAGRRALGQTVTEELRVGGRVLDRILSTRGRQLSETVRLLAADFAFREVVASEDQPTITSVLMNHGSRIGASAVFLIDLDGKVTAETIGGRFAGQAFPFAGLLERAHTDGEASGIASFERKPYQFVIVPVLAPQPIAWLCVGFRIDSGVVEDVHRLTALDVSIWTVSSDEKPVLISTLPPESHADLIEQSRLFSTGGRPGQETMQLASETYETILQPLATADGSRINVILSRSIEEARLPFVRLEIQIFILSSVALVIAIVASVFFARTVSRPLQRLAEGAQRIQRGDYATPVGVVQPDEIGRLATAFDAMQTGIGEREAQIRFQATHDGLTELPNRTLFLDRLAHAIASAKRKGGLVGMLMMDVDRFKDINDTLGHHFGDDLLVEIGRRLRHTIRESDTVARLGGDEFAVMFETDDATRATEAAQRISSAFETAFTLGSVTVDVRASVGIALYPLHAADPETLVKRADIAMYEAKKNLGSFALYEPGRDEYSLRRLAILSQLRQAIAQDELELHYQPKIEMGREMTVHAEALVRWQHPEHGLMPPDEFIPLAEQSGNIRMITKWVLRKAIGDCAEWNRSGMDLTVAVNLSMLDLYDAELPTYISGLLHESGLAPFRLMLEITESAVMRDATRAQGVLRELKSRGITLAIDDYGTGYSSLAQLKRLPVDELKIDKSFVMNLSGASTDDVVIVRSTIELGHNMGLRVIAEGVENVEAWKILKGLGCDMAQGFFVSRPLPAAKFVEWMKDTPWASGTVTS